MTIGEYHLLYILRRVTPKNCDIISLIDLYDNTTSRDILIRPPRIGRVAHISIGIN